MSADIYDVLTSLGIQLNDRGREWRCRPPYRESNNDTSLAIYKDNGGFHDFGIGARGSFKDLLKLILGTESQEEVEKYLETLKYEEDSTLLREPRLKMPTAFDPTVVQNLLPHYTFFQKRGISREILELFGGGMAGEGKMLRRYVFPIWNETHTSIVGFAGRDLTGHEDRVKWKLLGLKQHWCFPLFLNADIIIEKREVIIVESIGDMLALWQAGYQNVIVIFGVELPHYFAIFNRLVSLNPTRIIIGLNDDKDSEENNGQLGATRIQKSLGAVFDPRQIINAPPLNNDFGKMAETNINLIHEWYAELAA